MRICQNLITDYHSANFTEDETAWQPLPVVYNNGDEAREGNYIYKYAGISGTNSTIAPSPTSTSWLKTRASNYYAMLGDRTNQQTTTSGNLIIEIDVFNYDTLSLLNLTGTRIDIEVTDLNSMTVVYTDSKDLLNRSFYIDAYSHYFGEYNYFDRYYNDMIPLLGNARIRIEVVALSGSAGIGRLICGQSYYLGDTLFGLSKSLQSYSRVLLDEFGTPTLTESQNAVFNTNAIIKIASARIIDIEQKRKQLDFVPILFIGDESTDSPFENLLSYGLWEDATPTLQKPKVSELSMTIKELL